VSAFSRLYDRNVSYPQNSAALNGAALFYVGIRMKINLFQSHTDPEVFGFTADSTGEKLPRNFGPWRLAGKRAARQVRLAENLDGTRSSVSLIRAVKRDGFYLVHSAPRGITAPLLSGSITGQIAPPGRARDQVAELI
jgi:hypothetical protein